MKKFHIEISLKYILKNSGTKLKFFKCMKGGEKKGFTGLAEKYVSKNKKWKEIFFIGN